ncbi:MAG: T9SS type B sorting domain-containing protein, partial [Bacteroidales bacterium]|nr:T9SS type B sorting domain-containing protein [Bacteroidales bacterium]
AAVQALKVGATLTETFTYEISDGNGGTNTASLEITINGVNDAPVANDDSNTIDEDAVSVDQTDGSGTLIFNDTDVDLDALTVSKVGAETNAANDVTGTYGTINWETDGTYVYTIDNSNAAVQALNNGETLTETFIYTVNDGNSGTNTANLIITINGKDEPVGNTAPVANDDSNAIDEDAVSVNQADGSGTLIFNDTDVDLDALTVSKVGAETNAANDVTGTYGTINWETDGTYIYTIDNSNAAVQALNNGETLTETFIYTVNDGNSGTNTANLTITINGKDEPVGNTAPVANDDSNAIDEDAVSVDQADGSGTLIFNDTDVDLDALTVSKVGAETNAANDVTGTYGTINWETDGTYIYTIDNSNAAVQALNNGETLTETFIYTVNDGNSGTSTANLVITINGKEEAGITTTLTGGSNETSEDETSDSFDVVLNNQPLADVVIDITGIDATEGNLDKIQLTFTNTNWNTAQTVTVTGQDDDLIDGDIDYTLTLIVDDANSDDSYDGKSATVEVANLDNNTAEILTSLSGDNMLTSEDGTEDYVDIVLRSQPDSDVVIDILDLDITEGSLDKTELIFTSANWNVPQTITVTGVDDDELDGDINYELILSVNDADSDDNYNGISVGVDVLNVDNESDDIVDLIIPEGFSPGDGQYNEEFYIEGLDSYDEASIRIYNRWGNLVYTDSNYKNDWTGTNNVNTGLGQELPSGTYYYLLEIKDNGKTHNGSIYIKRMNK